MKFVPTISPYLLINKFPAISHFYGFGTFLSLYIKFMKSIVSPQHSLTSQIKAIFTSLSTKTETLKSWALIDHLRSQTLIPLAYNLFYF